MVRHNNQLPHNLPQLRNLIKRDPASYKEEFLQQYDHFKSMLELFRLQPEKFIKDIDDLVMFIAQVSHCYPEEANNFPQQIIDILNTHYMVLSPEMRMAFCKGLIVLRNRNLLAPTDLLSLFFHLLRCQDKNLRTFLENHIVTDIKNINSKHKDAKLNTTLQNFMFGMLNDSNAKAAKMSLDIMVQLYKKNIWNDAKTVNVISTACFSKIAKVMAAALKFFLGSDVEQKSKESDDSDSDDDEIDPIEIMKANKVNKKSRKREKQLKKVKKLVQKNKKKKEKAQTFHFSALHLIYDPQGFAEKLFRRLEVMNHRFEVKLMILNVVSKLIGIHQLTLFNFYPYVQRYVQPHQQEVVQILLFAAQASHELVPPDAIEPILRTIANNFVTERNSSDAMAIGINAIREICARCPHAMNEDLLGDLAMYKNYKERSVMMAAKSLINVYRITFPKLLRKKDRGKPTEAMLNLKTKPFGAIEVTDYVPGAEVVAEEGPSSENVESDGAESNSDSDSDWVDVSDSEDEKEKKTNKNEESLNTLQRKAELAAEASLNRLLTDEDFKKIDIAQLKKQLTSVGKGKKRSAEEAGLQSRSELASLKDIENIYKKRKRDKGTRVDSVKSGQESREKYGFKDRRVNPLCSKTNREKKKTKAYGMIKHKVKQKVKRSFREKQISLRNHLLKQKKMK